MSVSFGIFSFETGKQRILNSTGFWSAENEIVGLPVLTDCQLYVRVLFINYIDHEADTLKLHF